MLCLSFIPRHDCLKFLARWTATSSYARTAKTYQEPFLLCRELAAQSPTVGDAATSDHDLSNALLALGIMIWSCDSGSQSSRDLSEKFIAMRGDMTASTAAIEWQKKSIGEAGIILYDITYRCIGGTVGPTTINLDDSDCVRAVLDQVTKPLEGMLTHF
ncbi:hypothetical protein F5Y05DRAFT_397665 [Hypoxylon sp. FL0543]|nr:hypothetical protein F5Y05DRAFT_397665 [Hypoxylon sp. FL0543]